MRHDIPRHIAQTALAEQMLLRDDRARASELFLLNGRMYRVTLETVAPEDVKRVTAQYLEEHQDASQRTD